MGIADLEAGRLDFSISLDSSRLLSRIEKVWHLRASHSDRTSSLQCPISHNFLLNSLPRIAAPTEHPCIIERRLRWMFRRVLGLFSELQPRLSSSATRLTPELTAWTTVLVVVLPFWRTLGHGRRPLDPYELPLER